MRVGTMGEASVMATLALWLLAPRSPYITEQSNSHDGGIMQGVFG